MARIVLDYVRCSWCGYLKYCRIKDGKWLCRACELQQRRDDADKR